MTARLMPGLERRLRAEITGDVLFDRFNRGRYATDASSYQIMPLGVVVPRTVAEAERAIALARNDRARVLPQGGGTSQCGQAVNDALVIDCSKHLNRLLDLDAKNRSCVVEPGIVLDDLNRQLKPHGLWFPVDVSTASRATIGGMAGNNSCGSRSLRYGTMRDNVISLDAVLADGTPLHFGPLSPNLAEIDPNSPLLPLTQDLFALGAREAEEVAARFPKVQRRVGGYNLDAIVPGAPRNLAHLLVGSEGTLGFFTHIELKLSPILGKRAVGACHFGSFYAAMDAAQHLVKLKPIAVELVDATLLDLASSIAMFRPTLEKFVRGKPEAILLVEFAECEKENARRLKALTDTLADLGFGWDRRPGQWGGVVEVLDPALQAAIADLRTAGLNIMMSMKDAGKPVSFVEDCAVPLEHLAEYTARLTDVFEKHGTCGTWYAHAAEGCLHVRPILNLRLDKDVKAMRAIAEEAFEMVRDYKGSHSGEHGDGIVRSEFHEMMFGTRLVRAFEEVKDRFDPQGLYNPGRIVRAPKFDDRRFFRYGPGYAGLPLETHLDWSTFPGAGGGFQGAVEMCNNNGACRKLEGGVMCPSYRVTRNEQDVTRGRANTLRLAITGQLGPDALTSNEMAETLKLCVSCKGCRRECPTGVDMARMKIEVLAARFAKGGYSVQDRLVGWLPRYAPVAAKVAPLLNLRDRLPGAARLSEAIAGFSARRALPYWRSDVFAHRETAIGPADGREVVLFADTFNRYFERENLDAALDVLVAGGYRVHVAKPRDGGRPLCCGRTFLSVGAADEAKREAERVLAALDPFVLNGVPIVGLEPSCLLSFRDEVPALLKNEAANRLAAHALLFEEFLIREQELGRLALTLGALNERALLHGHCHQKAFAIMGAVEKTLQLVPGLKVETIESSCCGMAGAFGYGADTIEVSRAMAELSLLPAVRQAGHAIIVADGISCRQQIRDGTGREAVHVAKVLAFATAKGAMASSQ
jgi:FAD/FMN-containing dehydrogenase/Fe-S oxidoreductase